MTQWSYRQAWCCLIGSTLCTLCLSLGGFFIWKNWKNRRLHDPRFQVVAIVQTGPRREALKTAYLAELLGLSADQFTSLYALSTKEAERILCESPLIAKARVKRVPPGTLYIDYTIREPIAWFSDYENMGVDHEGKLFPMTPFFSPKQLPEVYLGLQLSSFQQPLNTPSWRLAFDLIQLFKESPWESGLRLKRIDVSNAFAKSYGQREIVLFTEEEVCERRGGREVVCRFPKVLRLHTKEYVQQLSNFFSLRQKMIEDYRQQIAHKALDDLPTYVQFAPCIIDLRIPQLAFVQN